MKKEEKKEEREKNLDQLKSDLEKEEKKLIEAEIKLRQGQLKNVHLRTEIKKRIAVIKTIIREKELEEEAKK